MDFHSQQQIPSNGWVWVFGSNEAGIHSVGDARIAKNNFGAMYGVSSGRVRNSYAIPARDKQFISLPLKTVKAGVDAFLLHAAASPGERFFVSRVGCTPGGLKDEDVAPFFASAPDNCVSPDLWKPIIEAAEVAA